MLLGVYEREVRTEESKKIQKAREKKNEGRMGLGEGRASQISHCLLTSCCNVTFQKLQEPKGSEEEMEVSGESRPRGHKHKRLRRVKGEQEKKEVPPRCSFPTEA